jgi:TonB family protein
MRLPVRFPIATMVLAFCSATASAQWRCDCTTIVDSCTAEVSIQPNWVDVRTDDAQCSRVDYFIDGLPFVTLVVEGEARQDWIATAGDARVVVQSCQVCRDLAESSPLEATANGEAPEAGPLEPLVMVTATYPVDAQKRGLEGFVEVEFTVTPFGDVQQARVTNAEPAGVFERAALSAVSRWRYPPDESRE